MSKAVQIFNNAEFGDIRTIQESGKVLFCATDVARALGYAKPQDAIQRHCRYSVKRGVPHPQSPDKTIEMNFIPESDLYRLIVNSQLESAQRFEAWVFEDVLPAIRKTGSYSIRPDKAKHLELAEGRLNAQRARLLQRMIENPAYPITDDSKRVLIHEVTLLATGHEHPEILPEATERLYSAKQLGDLLGTTNRAVHKIAAALGIKPEEGTRNEYAVWKMSKSPYGPRECGQLFFTELGRARIADTLGAEE